MGVQISDIIPRKEITISDLKGKTIAIDAFNTLYQFLTGIRQMDGTSLMDKNGRITSHLSGLFYRNINLMLEGIKPIYVFDGKPPELKAAELERRRELKRISEEKFKSAKEAGDEKEIKKYAARFVKLTDEIISESKELLEAMGIPVIRAPSEGEAEASVLARAGKVWGSASQDYDSLLYATPFLVRNLTLARRKKSPAGIYIETSLELIEFQKVLDALNIDLDQLICLAILIGTDYNPGGVSGLGQKRALEFVQKYKSPKEIFEAVENSKRYELTFDWEIIFSQFKNYETKIEKIETKKIDEEKVKEILLSHDFSENRIDSGLQKLQKFEESKKQKGLNEFF